MPHVDQIRTSAGEASIYRGFGEPGATFEEHSAVFNSMLRDLIQRGWERILGVDLDPTRIYTHPSANSESMPVDIWIIVCAWESDHLTEESRPRMEAWLQQAVEMKFLEGDDLPTIQVNLILAHRQI